jgi:ABC-type transport system substrate-binding protein
MHKRLLALAAAGVMVVTACGTSTTSTAPATSAEPGASAAPSAAAPSEAAGSADFRFALDGEPTYFSPAANDLPTSWINALLYTAMYRIDNTGTVVPDLATAMPEVSADGLSMTMTVRDGAVWHDGTPITAQDVLYSYNIALSEKCSMNASTCSVWHDNVASVAAPDDKTVVVTLKAPYAPFYILGLAPTYIVPQAATSASYERFVAGSGAVDAAAVKALSDQISAAQGDAACGSEAPPVTCTAGNYIADIEAQLTAAGVPLLDKSRYTVTDENGVTAPDAEAYATAALGQLTDLNTTLQAAETDKVAAAYRLLDINLAPVGSGAYKLGTYTPGQSVELIRNDDYYLLTPGPAKVLIPIIKAADAAADALVSGNIDWQTEVTSSDSLAKLKAASNVKLSEYPDLGYYFLAFNVREGRVFSDVVARQALAMCIDQAATVNVATEGNGVGVKAQVPPGSAYYDPSVPDYVHDVAGAKALLESNGYTLNSDNVYQKGDNKLEATLYVRQGRPQRVKFAELARDQVAECGIKLNVNEADFAAVLLPLLDHPNNFDIYLGGWANLFDPEDSNIFGCDHVTSAENPVDNNFTGYCDPAVDDLLNKAKAELDVEKRKALLAELQLKLHNDGPYYFLWADLGHRGYSTNVATTGDLGPIDYTTFYDFWNLDSWTVAK